LEIIFNQPKLMVMKKIFLFLLPAAIFLTSCNNDSGKKDDTAVNKDADDDDSVDSVDMYAAEIPESEARKMIDHWLSLPKNTENVIQQITLDGERLDKFLKKKDFMKMYMAAYLVPAGDHLKDDPTIIVSRIREGKRMYYDIYSIFPADKSATQQKPPPLCPPPTGCDFPLHTESGDSVKTVSDSTKTK
jgi:hypothetical protein